MAGVRAEISYVEATKGGRQNLEDAIWIDVGEYLPRADLGTLKYGFVGSWRSKSDYNPLVKELEAWARVA